MGDNLPVRSPVRPKEEKLNLTLAVTGASGSVFAVEMLRTLCADERVGHVNLVLSEAALRVVAEELGVSGRNGLIEKVLGQGNLSKITQLADADIGANVASGSYRCDGMIVLPCSMGTLAAIAHGLAASLIERAADVCLKERRPLLLCVRETPLNLVHIRNMKLVTEAGATVFPVMPVFYNKPQDTAEMVRQFVYRVLAHVGLPQNDAFEWKPD